MRLVYSAVHYLLMPFILLHLAWRGLRNPAYWRRWAERFGSGIASADERPVVWLHAVSVGEVQAAIPLVRGLLARYPSLAVLVTTTTPTGSERVRQALGSEVLHCYAPYDLPGAVQRFLNRIKPVVVVILETELWPNILHHCHRRSIPVLLANLRLSERSAKGYRHVPGLARAMLRNVSAIAAQSEDDAARLIRLGARRATVRVTGSVKFDVELPPSLREQAQVIRRAWGVDRAVWIAASTHEGEDEQVLEAFARVLRLTPNCLLVIVPRHPERFTRVASLCRRHGYHTVLRSDDPISCATVDVFIGDTMGELPVFYAASDVAFVGGSLVRVGGHNALEPAALGVPVVFGPHVFNFADISRRLCDIGAATLVQDTRTLADVVGRYLNDANLRHAAGQEGQRFVDLNRGAGDRMMAIIAGLIPAQLPVEAGSGR